MGDKVALETPGTGDLCVCAGWCWEEFEHTTEKGGGWAQDVLALGISGSS